MHLTDQYAKALHDVVARDPGRMTAFLGNLREAMKRRGHEKLLPSVLAAYERIEAADARRARLKRETPETKRTRALVELYKKLAAS